MLNSKSEGRRQESRAGSRGRSVGAGVERRHRAGGRARRARVCSRHLACGAAIDRAGEPTIIRTRYVDPNLELLLGEDGAPRDLAAGSTLTLNLFDDVVLVAVLDRVEPNYGGGFTWVGQVQDEPLSLVTLVVNDGVMAGTVALPKGCSRSATPETGCMPSTRSTHLPSHPRRGRSRSNFQRARRRMLSPRQWPTMDPRST